MAAPVQADSHPALAAQSGDLCELRQAAQQPHVHALLNEPHGEAGNTALLWACYYDEHECMAFLWHHPQVERGLPNKKGLNALHMAAISNSLRCLDLILQHPGGGLELNPLNMWQETPLHLAVAAGHTRVVQRLVDTPGVDLTARDAWGRTPHAVAIEHGEHALAALLPSGGSSGGSADGRAQVSDATGLLTASTAIRDEFMARLLDAASAQPAGLKVRRGADSAAQAATSSPATVERAVDAPLVSGQKPAVRAGPKKASLSQKVEFPGDVEAVRALLASPDAVDPAGKDFYGWTALHKFCAWNKPDLIALLLPHLHLPDHLNAPAGPDAFHVLHAAVDMGAVHALRFLLDTHSDVLELHHTDKRGRTPLQLAQEMGLEEAVCLLQAVAAERAEGGQGSTG